MPSSTTATSGRDRSSSSESGRPMWLFRFPLFRNTRYRAERNSAATSFVVVLPALPVIATTLAPERRRTSRATSCSARVVSADPNDARRRPPRPRCAPAPAGVDRRRASAPRPSALGDELVPSNRSPRIATNKSPGGERPRVDRQPTDRASMPRRGRLRRRSRRRSSPAVSASDLHALRHPRAAAASRQRRARDLDVVERQRPVADDLILLVSLAGDQHQIAGPRVVHGALDRGLPIAIATSGVDSWRPRPCRGSAIRRHHDAALDLLDDLLRVLRPRVVGRHDRPDRSAAPPPRPSAAAWCDRDRRRSRTP